MLSQLLFADSTTLTVSQKVPLAERAETQSVDIYEVRHVSGVWLYLMDLGCILCFLNYLLWFR